jgi:two-component system, chemotaxis family, chemotaxis protein CheY
MAVGINYDTGGPVHTPRPYPTVTSLFDSGCENISTQSVRVCFSLLLHINSSYIFRILLNRAHHNADIFFVTGMMDKLRSRRAEEEEMSLNILIVDDSAVIRAMILKTLRMAGIPLAEVYQAANGQEGLDSLEANWIDLIFADIHMPVMNGEEMINKIREQPEWEELPIIVVSTEGSATRIERLQQKGACFVHKPFTPEIVQSVIKEITGVSHEQTA